MRLTLAKAIIIFSVLSVPACGQDSTRQAGTPQEKSKRDDSRRAQATIEINAETGRFVLSDASSENAGNQAHVTNLATGAADELNKILDELVGARAVPVILNPEELRLTFGHVDQRVYYETPEGRTTTSAQAVAEAKAFNDAIMKTMKKIKVSGGNLFLKRALLNSKTTDKAEFDVEMGVGEEIETYLRNKRLIDAALDEPVKSTFARGWEKSLAIAERNGVRRTAVSDFYGGAKGFVESAVRINSKNPIRSDIEYEYVDFEIDGRDLTLTINEAAPRKRAKQSREIFKLEGFLNPERDPKGWTGYSRSAERAGAQDVVHFTGPKFDASTPSNDIYIGSETANSITGGPGHDWIDGGSGADKIKGGDGNDVLIAGDGNDVMSGGKGDDSLFAGAGSTEISGDLGNDRLIFSSLAGQTKAFGGAGDDTFFIKKITAEGLETRTADGGKGTDTVSFRSYNEAIDLTLMGGDQAVSLSGQTLTLASIENLSGSNYADSLTGDDRPNTLSGHRGNDKLDGKKGDDILEGGSGADSFTGGDGADTVSYANSYGGVDVSLEYKNPHAFGGDASGDTFKDKLENLLGSGLSDVLEGNRGDNVIQSGRGDDYIIATNGTDEYHGADGFDTVDYGNHKGDAGLTLNADKPITGYIDGVSEPAGQHILTGIDHLVGTTHADNITFGTGNQVLEGGKGDDKLTGGDGDDTYFVEISGGHDKIFEKGAEGRDIIMIGYESDLSWNDISVSIKDRTFRIFYKETLIASAENGPYKGSTFKDVGVEVLDLGGVGQIEISALESEVKGAGPTSNDDKISGENNTSNLLLGLDGNDEILFGTKTPKAWDKGNLIHGGRGDDIITAGMGDDTYIFDRGSGFDTISDFGGKDHIYFGPQVRKEDLVFETIGPDLIIGLKPRKSKRDDVFPANAMEDKIRIVNGAESRASAIESYTVQNKKYDVK